MLCRWPRVVSRGAMQGCASSRVVMQAEEEARLAGECEAKEKALAAIAQKHKTTDASPVPSAPPVAEAPPAPAPAPRREDGG